MFIGLYVLFGMSQIQNGMQVYEYDVKMHDKDTVGQIR